MNKLRILVINQDSSLPPDDVSGATKKQLLLWQTASDVITALHQLGHEVIKLGVSDEITPIREALQSNKPHVVFNLLEAFQGLAIYDQHVVSYLELMTVNYTGCNPRGLTLARDKALAKKILSYHRIRFPEFVVCPMGRKVRAPKRLEYPLIVKSLNEDASLGISHASIVSNDDKLRERVEFVHDSLHTDAIVERFIAGREVYVPILGNQRLQVLPTWEFLMAQPAADGHLIATEKAKFDPDYQKRRGVTIAPAADLPEPIPHDLKRISKRIYKILGLSGYARMDFRLDEEGRLFFLEANPNPDIARAEEVASAARAVGIDYEKLIAKIISLGIKR